MVTGRDFAVATSGVAERGPHIINPHTGRPAAGLASITVVGPGLALTDAYATAAFAMGPAALGLFPHALADVARLPVREVVSALHFKADLTLGLGTVAFDYLAK